MMKILTVIYILKYLIQIINGANKVYNIEFLDNIDKYKYDEKFAAEVFKFMILILMDFIEIPYICIALSYQKNIITIGYIIFWIVMFIIRQTLKGKKFKINKFINRVINVIDLSYFIYMFYIFFIK